MTLSRKGIPMLKLLRVRRIGRAAALVGVAGITVGGMLLGAGVAHAATVGKDPGAVQLSPASGPTSGKPTWSTTTACASGFQGSAIFREVHSDGTTTNSISPVVNGTAVPFSGTLQATIAQIQQAGGIPNGGTQELVVICFPGPSSTGGSSDAEMDIAIHYSADGSSYTTDTNFGGGGGGALSTSTTLTASPNPAAAGATVTLTATESASDGSHPAGSVQFSAGGATIGSPATVDASGVATTTTTFSTAGSVSLSATFTPTDTTGFTSSTGTATETVSSQGGGPSATEPLAVTVPQSGPGSFTLTVGSGTVSLTVSGSNAAGMLNPITVTDTRNPAPGWSVSGLAADFTTGSATIPGSQLGWTPTDTSLACGATLGDQVTPGSPGLGTSAVLASAAAGGGTGTCALGANLTLAIPTSATPGDYSSTLTLTAVTAAP
jgi:Bacterial Ig-like domain (group 3)